MSNRPIRVGVRPDNARVREGVIPPDQAGRATVVLQRSISETAIAAMLGFTTLLLTLFAIAGAAPPTTELRCDRAADMCTRTTRALVGSSDVFRVSELASSTLHRDVNDRTGDVAVDWIAKTKDGRGIWLGSGGSEAQGRGFEVLSRQLATFIANPAQRVFRADFQSSGTLTAPVAIAVAVAAGVLALFLVDGWRTTLTFDRSAGELTIIKRPPLLPPAGCALPLASIAHFEVKPGMVWVLGIVLQTLTLRLSDAAGRTLYSRWQLISDDARREIETVREFIGSG